MWETIQDWRPQGDSNPCCRRERAVSWASRRWGQYEIRLAHGQAAVLMGREQYVKTGIYVK